MPSILSVGELPREFDTIMDGKGFTMAGWDFTRAELVQAIADGRMLNPAFELASNCCPWNCAQCFTEDPSNMVGKKRRLEHEIGLERKLKLIDEAAALGARSINFVGAGEPTIDPDFWALLERMQSHLIRPIVYTEASIRLTDQRFVRRLYDLDATVVVKVNSLWNRQFQNSVVAGRGSSRKAENYFDRRNEAIDQLMNHGFARFHPTRLAFDTVVCSENVDEMARLHEWARESNVFVLMVTPIPSGRSSARSPDDLEPDRIMDLRRQIAKIDRDKYRLFHSDRFPYIGGAPCTIRGLGLYMKIEGQVLDCPGGSRVLGNVQTESLADIWKRVRPITLAFDGGCLPREAAAADGKVHLPVRQ
jgi:MoaA/NifB/PqqE/SkfB family radical SAM enzyme